MISTVLAIILALISLAGVALNSLIITVLTRSKRLLSVQNLLNVTVAIANASYTALIIFQLTFEVACKSVGLFMNISKWIVYAAFAAIAASHYFAIIRLKFTGVFTNSIYWPVIIWATVTLKAHLPLVLSKAPYSDATKDQMFCNLSFSSNDDNMRFLHTIDIFLLVLLILFTVRWYALSILSVPTFYESSLKRPDVTSSSSQELYSSFTSLNASYGTNSTSPTLYSPSEAPEGQVGSVTNSFYCFIPTMISMFVTIGTTGYQIITENRLSPELQWLTGPLTGALNALVSPIVFFVVFRRVRRASYAVIGVSPRTEFQSSTTVHHVVSSPARTDLRKISSTNSLSSATSPNSARGSFSPFADGSDAMSLSREALHSQPRPRHHSSTEELNSSH